MKIASYTNNALIISDEIEINTPTGKIKAIDKRHGKYDIYILGLNGSYVFDRPVLLRPKGTWSAKGIYEAYMRNYI